MSPTLSHKRVYEIMSISKKPFSASVIVLSLHLFMPAIHAADAGTAARRFSTPEEAVSALQRATSAADTNALRAVLGPGSEDLENSDRIQAMTELKTFSSALAETNRLARLSDTRVILELGHDFWPFPVPIVKKDGGWFFDTDAGKDELLSRRVGGNELAVLPTLRAYVDAQRQYASLDHDGDGVLEFAQRLVSSRGKEDGLYWTPLYDGDVSPFGPLVAFAQAEGCGPGHGEGSRSRPVPRIPF